MFATPPSSYPRRSARTTPMASPSPQPGAYFTPKFASFAATPVKSSTRGHARRASYEPGYYLSPRPPPYQTPPVYAYESADDNPMLYSTPRRDHVSPSERLRAKGFRSADPDGIKQPGPPNGKYHYFRTQTHAPKFQAYEDEGYFSPRGSPPPPYETTSYQTKDYWGADYTEKVYKQQQPEPPVYKSRARATSHPTPASSANPSTPAASTARKSGGSSSKSTRKRPSTSSGKPAPAHAQATAEDALRAGIPAGFSLKNWDPAESPIFLLGSVFDANSLGKWIYDWTVFAHGAATPLAELAGDLWLLLIQIAGKIKRAEECLPRVRRSDDCALVADFLDGGDRLWSRFTAILKTCEDHMWRAAKRQGATSGAPAMGQKSGVEFVDSIFGRDRKLEDTERLMTGMRLWSHRFDANCERILRRPTK